jgi:hypothetical protein
MEEDSIIQGQSILEVLFALLLTLVTSYAYILCRAYACRMDAADAKRSSNSCSRLLIATPSSLAPSWIERLPHFFIHANNSSRNMGVSFRCPIYGQRHLCFFEN